MKALWTFVFVLAVAVFILWFVFQEPAPEKPISAPTPKAETPSLEIVEEAESIVSYSLSKQKDQAEMVKIIKAVTVKNPHAFPVSISSMHAEY
ncbi:hypothetical protein [Paenibacillus sp. MBLB4367]|uniref:hypothetical protein n=1 Tax=Paenibacillus sp. MBLB4367 TaxID=3384767 RepID=UPI0039080DAA